MAEQRLIVAIGRIERALSRLEQMPKPATNANQAEIGNRHETLKAETRAAIADIDLILAGGN
jgi:hypothetical protein